MAIAIPKFQRAAWLDDPKPNARLILRDDLPVETPSIGEVLIKLEYSGVCHSDVHGIHGETPMSTNIAGHEGIGKVVQIGPQVSEELLGVPVGVQWLYSTCGSCEICEINSVACPQQHNSGRDKRGSFQQYMIYPAAQVTRLPPDLSPERVAPLLCAGLTMYSAIAKAKLRPGDWLAIPGAGGGLGHLGVQIAVSFGLRAIAIDTGEDKREICMSYGAAAFIDFKTDEVELEVRRLSSGLGVHAVICSAGSESAYSQASKLLRNLGTLICIGLPRSSFHVPISPFEMVVRGLTVVGSSVGTSTEMQSLLRLASAGHVVPHVEVYEFERINEVVDKVAKSQMRGRAVLRIPD